MTYDKPYQSRRTRNSRKLVAEFRSLAHYSKQKRSDRRRFTVDNRVQKAELRNSFGRIELPTAESGFKQSLSVTTCAKINAAVPERVTVAKVVFWVRLSNLIRVQTGMSGDHPLQTVETLLLVAIGGAIGANLRYVVGIVLPGLWGTFTANVTGCFLLGLLLYEDRYTGILADRSRIVFGTGALSSYTTYSTFAVETVQTASVWGIINVVANYAIGFAAVLLARAIMLRLGGRRVQG